MGLNFVERGPAGGRRYHCCRVWPVGGPGVGGGGQGGACPLTLSVASLVVYPPAHPAEGEPCTAMAGAWGEGASLASAILSLGTLQSLSFDPWGEGGGCQRRTWRSGHRFGGGHWSMKRIHLLLLG